jgi:aryl-alcohol dehydrogenase-like predicted oxidoreductase
VKGAQNVLRAGFGSVLEVIYNALDRRAESTVLPEAEKAGHGVIARVPLASGFLAGTYDERPESFSATDYRSMLVPEEVRWRARSSRELSFLAELPGGMAVSALRFCLSRSEISTVIPGMRRCGHVEKNVLASEHGPLDAAYLKRIAQSVPRVYEGWEA